MGVAELHFRHDAFELNGPVDVEFRGKGVMRAGWNGDRRDEQRAA
jgi:hypothetical protein